MISKNFGNTEDRTSSYVSLCLRTLKDHGLRITNTRRIAAEAIGQLGEAFTAKSLHDFIEERLDPEFDFATLYRIVQKFEALGLVHSDSRNGGYVLCTHLACDDFIHVIYSCQSCQESFEDHLPRAVANHVSKAITHKQGFRAVSSVMQVKGMCSSCRS